MSSKMYYLYQAADEAMKSNLQCKHGSIIVKGGKILGRGYNKGSVHAECDAINHLLNISSRSRRRKKCVL